MLGELAEARLGDPLRRQETLLRRAVLLEGTEDPHAAVDAFAAILEEFPQEGAALSGLARALSRPGSRAAAARLLEKTYRAAGDKVKLAELLEVRLEDMGQDERRAALPEIAALREACGQTAEAFDARVRQYADERRDPDAEPAIRMELLRLAAAAGREDRLADILESSIAEGLPDAGAASALASLGRPPPGPGRVGAARHRPAPPRRPRRRPAPAARALAGGRRDLRRSAGRSRERPRRMGRGL